MLMLLMAVAVRGDSAVNCTKADASVCPSIESSACDVGSSIRLQMVASCPKYCGLCNLPSATEAISSTTEQASTTAAECVPEIVNVVFVLDASTSIDDVEM
jgi:hypothetical protein